MKWSNALINIESNSIVSCTEKESNITKKVKENGHNFRPCRKDTEH